MFRHRSAIFRESIKTKECKSNTPIQVLIALTIVIKILTFSNSRIHEIVKQKTTML